MNYTLEVAPSVIKDASKIFAYRERESKGSGDHFTKALNDCYERIIENPYGYQVRRGPFRHVMLCRLKYRLVYKVEDDTVYVVQVRHTSRKPNKKFGP